MHTLRIFAVLVSFLGCLSTTKAAGRPDFLQVINCQINGQVIDHTANSHCDRRIYSCALDRKRDLYVYLPPGFDPRNRYPLLIWLHGLATDEQSFVKEAIPRLDKAISRGQLAPFIVAIPDGTRRGRAGLLSTHTVFLNSRLGCYANYLMHDVWNFVHRHYPIRPEREAHILGGVSIGGGAAYHHAIKSRDRIAHVLGIYPSVNVRWKDCRGRYFGNFDPCWWGWRTSVCWGHEPLGRYYGFIRVPLRRLVYPLYGRGKQAVRQMSRDNPLEMIDHYHLEPGQLSMFIAYGGKDEFNIDAQVESFVYRAGQRGLKVKVIYDPEGRHSIRTARRFFPPAIQWLAPRLEPFRVPINQPADLK